jgi:hypothetical protein
MSQILAIRGEVRNHPLTFEFAIEYNKGVGSRRTAPAQGIETSEHGHEGPPLRRGLKLFIWVSSIGCSGHEGPPLRRGLKLSAERPIVCVARLSRRTAPAQGIEP